MTKFIADNTRCDVRMKNYMMHLDTLHVSYEKLVILKIELSPLLMVIAYRLECHSENGGLTHYVMGGENSPF